ncbi:hypothetical protein B296_00025110 [Ensete ventricosum]|uniref:Uncharacterized protein n=1 Tax=Ensete ventricosum TaxID=4639 RepID=A0A426ZB46_ENSVE|nr:hypothetical protein B296_00025110 [Ensete ventricosum]
MLCEAMSSHASAASCDSKRCEFCYVPLLSRVVLLRDATVSESGYVIDIALRCVRYFGGGGGTMCGLRPQVFMPRCTTLERVGSTEVQSSGLHVEVHDSGAHRHNRGAILGSSCRGAQRGSM